jgi:Flp pilus assembly pilin Flp
VSRRSKLIKAEDGASLVEYALLIALITIVCIVAIGALGNQIVAFFNVASGSL